MMISLVFGATRQDINPLFTNFFASNSQRQAKLFADAVGGQVWYYAKEFAKKEGYDATVFISGDNPMYWYLQYNAERNGVTNFPKYGLEVNFYRAIDYSFLFNESKSNVKLAGGGIAVPIPGVSPLPVAAPSVGASGSIGISASMLSALVTNMLLSQQGTADNTDSTASNTDSTSTAAEEARRKQEEEKRRQEEDEKRKKENKILKLAKKFGINVASETSRQLLENFDMKASEWIAKFRLG